jgi:tRNA 2-selenouridine synthase
VWVEAESSKIGQVHLPNELWQAMKTADGVELDVTAEERAAYLLRTYRHLVADPDVLKRLVRRLRHRLSEQVIGEWVAAVDAGRWTEFVADVLEQHYDPAYRHSRERDFPQVTDTLRVDSLSDDGLRQVAADLGNRATQGVAV